MYFLLKVRPSGAFFIPRLLDFFIFSVPSPQDSGFGRCSRRRIASNKHMSQDDGQQIGREFVQRYGWVFPKIGVSENG